MIQVDAAGYLIGWGDSYFGSQTSEKKRINAGITAAESASTLGILTN